LPLLSLNTMLTRCSSGIIGREIVQSVQANVVHGTRGRAMEATTTIGRIFTSISEVQFPTLSVNIKLEIAHQFVAFLELSFALTVRHLFDDVVMPEM